MADTLTISNSYIAYYENDPYQYTLVGKGQSEALDDANRNVHATGWHIVPNILWEHYLTPKDWYEMIIKNEAYQVVSTSQTLFNPIPVTENLAIQGTTTFPAFNNTIYSIGASDDVYETNWHNYYVENYNKENTGQWWGFNLAFKEGLLSSEEGPNKRLMFPKYIYIGPSNVLDSKTTWCQGLTDYRPEATCVWPFGNDFKQSNPNGVFWDPMTDPSKLLELRPGKNSITFNWNVHPSDENIWFNFDQFASFLPYCSYMPSLAEGNQGPPKTEQVVGEPFNDPYPLSSRTTGKPEAPLKDYTIPDMRKMPIVNIAWFWKEMQNTILRNSNDLHVNLEAAMTCAGTEYAATKYPPTQNFIKGIPIFNDDGHLIKTTTQVSVTTTITLRVKKRRSKLFAPTWGPMSWQMTHTMSGPFTPAFGRYRTGGARIPWTNMNTLSSADRHIPYVPTTYPTTFTQPVFTQSGSSLHHTNV